MHADDGGLGEERFTVFATYTGVPDGALIGETPALAVPAWGKWEKNSYVFVFHTRWRVCLYLCRCWIICVSLSFR